jgi:hypothetical protein
MTASITRRTCTCPACGEEILAVARKCKHCETLFGGHVSSSASGGSGAHPSASARGVPSVRAAHAPIRVTRPTAQSPASRAPRAVTRSDRGLLPRMFASLAALIAIAAAGVHYRAWQGLQVLTQLVARHRGEALPLIPSEASERAWKLYDSMAGAAASCLLFGTIVAGLLVIVSWGLWHRSWWAPRVILLWSSLVGCMLVSDYMMTQQVEDELLCAEDDAMRALVERTSDWLGLRHEALASAAPVLVPWVDRIFLAALNAKMDFAFGWALRSYAFVVAWFPAAIALIFCRPGARRYFGERANS